MFDFEKLEVYKKAKNFNKDVLSFLRGPSTIDSATNIAEGTSRFSKADKRHFYVISRGSAFECIAVFDILYDEAIISLEEFRSFYGKGEELSRMLFKMIDNLTTG